MTLGRGFAIENQFMIREIVYVRVDESQRPRIVTGIIIRDGYYEYEVSSSDGYNRYAEFELTNEKTIW